MENPSNTQHQQAFVDVSEAGAGLVVANVGLNEYEVLRDGRIRLPLHFFAPLVSLAIGACSRRRKRNVLANNSSHSDLSVHLTEMAYIRCYAQAYQFQIPWTLCQTDIHIGKISHTFAPFSGKAVRWRSPL